MDILSAIILFSLCRYSSGHDDDGCDSPQYLEIGEEGVIQCLFQRSFYGVLWFHSAQVDRETPFIKLLGFEKSGVGYSSGEYDVYQDGSLVINNVTHIYDRNFTVAKIDSLSEEPVTYDITIITTVKPRRSQPQIDQCRNDNRSCVFIQGTEMSTISCSIGPSRPAIHLKWFLKAGNEERLIQSRSSHTSDGVTFTSHAAIPDMFPEQSFLNLLVCRAKSLPGMLLENEVFALLQNRQLSPSNVQPKKMWAKRGSELKLPCLETKSELMIWQRSGKENNGLSTVGYAIFSEMILNTYFDDFKLEVDGSLVVQKVGIKHEGVYECSSQNQDSGGKIVYEVVVYVPSCPVVRGCVPNRTCALDVPDKGQLICDVAGIRPSVDLEWNLVYEQDSDYITFTEHETSRKQSNDVYDVSLSSNFRIHDADWVYVIAVECNIVETTIKDLAAATTVTLIPRTEWGSDVPFYVGVVGYIAVILFLYWALQILGHRIMRPKQQDGDQDNEQLIPMMQIAEQEEGQEEGQEEAQNICTQRNQREEEEGRASNSDGRENKQVTFRQVILINGMYVVYIFIAFIGMMIIISKS